MINRALFVHEMKKSTKMLLLFSGILTLYISIIMGMYDADSLEALIEFYHLMPELMDAVGMDFQTGTLIEYLVSYLYGFLLLVFPMVFSIFRSHSLVSKYVDDSSITPLIAAPIKRREFIFTQIVVLFLGVFSLVAYTTFLQWSLAKYWLSSDLILSELLLINAGLLGLQLFIASICFLSSCIFSDAKYSIAFGAGIPSIMFIINMLANVGGEAEKARFLTFFSLFQPIELMQGENTAYYGMMVLAIGAICLFVLGNYIFTHKDLHI